MQDLVSIIVPVYNTETYLDKCIQSLSSQDYSKLQIILVNDGSTDSSLKICQKHAERDDRIIVIDQDNRGIGFARNAGLDIATGDFIGFVDSDDYVSKDMYEKLINASLSSGADIVECDYYRVDEDENFIGTGVLEESKIIGNYDCCRNYLMQDNTTNFTCNKFYRKEILADIRFAKLNFSEDFLFNVQAFYNCSKKVTISDRCYFYVDNPHSVTKSEFEERNFDILKAAKKALEFHAYRFPDLQRYIILYLLNKIRHLYLDLMNSDVIDKSIFKKRLIDNFDFYYPQIKDELNEITKFRKTRVALKLFSISPKAYYLVEKMKNSAKLR